MLCPVPVVVRQGYVCSCSAGWEFNATLLACRPIACPADYRVEDSACVACPAGQMHAPGALAIGEDTECVDRLCGAMEYVADHECVPCAVGFQRPAGDNAFGADTACTEWFCEEDEYVKDHHCVACGYGGTRDAGDSATGNNTECFVTLCAVDQCVYPVSRLIGSRLLTHSLTQPPTR